jgi:hypothetical protein
MIHYIDWELIDLRRDTDGTNWATLKLDERETVVIQCSDFGLDRFRRFVGLVRRVTDCHLRWVTENAWSDLLEDMRSKTKTSS